MESAGLRQSLWGTVKYCFLRLNLTLKYIRESDDNLAEGSRPAAHNISDVDDPFTNVISKNVMPAPPNKERKVYLEDYENFVVK